MHLFIRVAVSMNTCMCMLDQGYMHTGLHKDITYVRVERRNGRTGQNAYRQPIHRVIQKCCYLLQNQRTRELLCIIHNLQCQSPCQGDGMNAI